MDLLRAALRPDQILIASRRGRWRLPWAMFGTALAVGLTFFLLIVAQSIAEGLGLSTSGDGEASGSRLAVPGDIESYTILVSAFLPIIIAGVLTFQLVHGRPWADWPTKRITGAWGEFGKATAAFALVFAIGHAVGYAIFPERYAVTPRGIAHLPWLLLGLALILVQAFAEEAAFKGYLYRVWGAVFPYRWPLVMVLSVIFTALHWDNEDFARDRGIAIVLFTAVTVLSYWLYFRTGSLGAATGMHWANNVFAILVLPAGGTEFALSGLGVYTDPVLAAGGTNLTNPEAWISIIGGIAMYVALIVWPRSPFHIAERKPEFPADYNSPTEPPLQLPGDDFEEPSSTTGRPPSPSA